MFFGRKPVMVSAAEALPGRNVPVYPVGLRHEVFGIPIDSTPEGTEVAYFALGCFWGEEKMFWNTEGVRNTAVGYQGGFTPNPTYEEVCSGLTGHTETVRVCFDPTVVSYAELVRQFFEAHDPTQGFRQGNDVGTQYRSALFVSADQEPIARAGAETAQAAYSAAGFGQLTTEIADGGEFFFAEDYHQQYLLKNPAGYCPVHATGVACG
ncbi:peptide-methionine (S)-S-oxide reductase MsrA [Granulicoccus sp. GXG6511]|uniref:peptide-methionine (S)-S-oxide reductase MsrA n=1 Tax=Granulicoccus sp. GXG6511 TaxID=3381351 RepID=UPI003D7C49CB